MTHLQLTWLKQIMQLHIHQFFQNRIVSLDNLIRRVADKASLL
jgi:hypothetical protein